MPNIVGAFKVVLVGKTGCLESEEVLPSKDFVAVRPQVRSLSPKEMWGLINIPFGPHIMGNCSHVVNVVFLVGFPNVHPM